jgi:hypothetical protein
MNAVVPVTHTKRNLSLSEGPELAQDLAETAAYIETQLAWVDWYRAHGCDRQAEAVTDRLYDYIFGPALTESEARLMDGNR